MTMSISPKYGVEFEELGDSPRIRMRKNGVSATRIFRVPDWTKANDLAKELIGEYGALGVVPQFSLPIPFPGFANLLVSDLDIDPMDGQSPAGLLPVSLGGDMNVYPGGAKITALYAASFDVTGGTGGPNIPEGTTLVVNGNEGTEVYSTPGRVWSWGTVAGNPKVDPDTFPGLVIPTGDFTMTWSRIPIPPWDAIRSLKGKVNSVVFNRSPVGCLMFSGCRYRRMFQFLQSNELWEMEYSFREVIKERNDLTQVGWNYFYREQASGGEHWHTIQNATGNPPFKSGDFNDLFKFAVTNQ